MADKVYPTSKPQTLNGAGATTANPSFPTTKPNLYGSSSRPIYRPQPKSRRGRSCCCFCCLWLTCLIIFIVIIAAVASAVFYFLYRPHRPSFSVTSLEISQLNLTSSSTLTSNFNLTVSARNPNKKLVYIYDPVAITVFSSSHDVSLGGGTIPAFVSGRKNTTSFTASITDDGQSLDSTTAKNLQSDLKTKGGVPLQLELNTKVKVRIGGLKTNKVAIRVTCDGIKATLPKGKTSTSGVKCSVDLRIKIWKWTF